MQSSGVSNYGLAKVGISQLKSANEQSQRAGELISKTVAGLLQTQDPVQPLDRLVNTGTGTVIDTTA